MIIVKISSEESQAVEKAFYEYNAALNILSYLLKQENVNQQYFDQYTKKSEQYFVTLENLKNIISNKYMPQDGQNYDYSFNFINEEIQFYPKGE